jgi:hypothetical protein
MNSRSPKSDGSGESVLRMNKHHAEHTDKAAFLAPSGLIALMHDLVVGFVPSIASGRIPSSNVWGLAIDSSCVLLGENARDPHEKDRNQPTRHGHGYCSISPRILYERVGMSASVA